MLIDACMMCVRFACVVSVRVVGCIMCALFAYEGLGVALLQVVVCLMLRFMSCLRLRVNTCVCMIC